MIKGLPSVNFQNFLGKDWLNLFVGEGGELLLGDHQVAVVDVDEGILERSDMSGTHLNRFLVKN